MARFREGEEIGTTRGFVWMDASWQGPLAEGLPCVRSSLLRAPSQPSSVRRDTPHECSSLRDAMTKILTASRTRACAGAASTDMVRLKRRLTSKRARFSAELYWRVAHQANARTGRLSP